MTRSKRKRPEFAAMLAALERARAGYGAKLAREATNWPSRGHETRALIRRQVGSDFDHLSARQRAEAIADEDPNPDQEDDQ